jgi:stringent starvation protein B
MNNLPPSHKQKYDTLIAYLQGDHALVHVNPKLPGVQLPPQLAGRASVSLKLSRLFRGYLEIGEDKITADLLFGGRYFTCIVPLDAMWSCTSARGENVIWPESTTPEVLQELAASASAAAKKAKSAKPKSKPKPRGPGSRPTHLKRVK